MGVHGVARAYSNTQGLCTGADKGLLDKQEMCTKADMSAGNLKGKTGGSHKDMFNTIM